MDDINADEYSEDSDNESIVEEENLVGHSKTSITL